MQTPAPWQIAARELAKHLAASGIRDERVLARITAVPRHRFIPEDLQSQAYADTALGIGLGQTISQPYIVALMTEAARLAPQSQVLEIGTGSGYQAAILSGLCQSLITIERLASLADSAQERFAELKLTNIECHVADGTLGWPESAPYDAILVTAGAPTVPELLLEQLADGGRLVLPVGPETGQSLLAYERRGDQFRSHKLCDCRFVKLVGVAGWAESAPSPDG
ncbi:MAG TPA: protein-L-isoaspartate(D-aspartate) O-methyltransferase [Planctomycetaceae bacterium]|nr:protein-L-isoaspartate(D-aspartate) O-methyltransferase [Planctomycetaceae bacterium]